MIFLVALFGVVAVFPAGDAANIDRFGGPCLGNTVNCFVDPCMVSKGCPGHPEAVCVSNYCGGCHAFYYKDGKRVTCDQPIPPVNIEDNAQPETRELNGFQLEEGCPPTGLNGACLVMCTSHDDCGDGNRCCSTGCGRVCKPLFVSNKTEPARQKLSCPLTKPGTIGTCVEMCSSHAMCGEGELCCSNGCGHTCKTGILRPTLDSNIDESAPVVQRSVKHIRRKSHHIKKVALPVQHGCPTPGMWPCVTKCSSNQDCFNGQLCCSTGCGALCMGVSLDQLRPKLVCPVADESEQMGLCAEMCSSDNDCETGQMCCSNGCGRSCKAGVDPNTVPPKPKLTCPVVKRQDFGVCAEMCLSDDDCATGELCCSTGCGHSCQAGVRTTIMKPVEPAEENTGNRDDLRFPIKYSCPKMEEGTVGLCMSNCESDADCNGGSTLMNNSTLKCCSNGCGSICTPGVIPLKTGSCPEITKRGPCVMTCATHAHCDGELLCCPNGCGQVCKPPTLD